MTTDVPDELFSAYPAKQCRRRIAAGTNRGIGYTDAMIPDADYGLRPIAVAEGDGFRLRKAKTRGSMVTRVWVHVDVRPDHQGGSVLRVTSWRPRRLRVFLAVTLGLGALTTVPLVLSLQSPIALAPAASAALLAAVIFPVMRRLANQERRLLIQQLSRIVRARTAPASRPPMFEARPDFDPRAGFAGESAFAPRPVPPPQVAPGPQVVPGYVVSPTPPLARAPLPAIAPPPLAAPRPPRALPAASATTSAPALPPTARALPPAAPATSAQQPPTRIPRQRTGGIPLISQELAERSGAPISATLREGLPTEWDDPPPVDESFQVQVSGDPTHPPMRLLSPGTPARMPQDDPVISTDATMSRVPALWADPTASIGATMSGDMSADADTDMNIPPVPALPAPREPVSTESVSSASAVVRDILELIPAGLDVGPVGGLADVTFDVTRSDGVSYTTSARISFTSMRERKRVSVGARLPVRVDPHDQSRIVLE